MQYRAVLFDLDGTLANTLEDIAAAANHALEQLELSPIEPRQYLKYIGRGASWLMNCAVGEGNQARVPQAVELFQDYYRKHPVDRTEPYSGICELLDALCQRSVTIAIFSNKPDPATNLVVNRLFSRWPLAAVRGQRPDVPPKPDPAGALAISRKLEIPIEQWLYVGDSDVDMCTARNAGMCSVGVTWGYCEESVIRKHSPNHVINHPLELLKLLPN